MHSRTEPKKIIYAMTADPCMLRVVKMEVHRIQRKLRKKRTFLDNRWHGPNSGFEIDII